MWQAPRSNSAANSERRPSGIAGGGAFARGGPREVWEPHVQPRSLLSPIPSHKARLGKHVPLGEFFYHRIGRRFIRRDGEHGIQRQKAEYIAVLAGLVLGRRAGPLVPRRAGGIQSPFPGRFPFGDGGSAGRNVVAHPVIPLFNAEARFHLLRYVGVIYQERE